MSDNLRDELDNNEIVQNESAQINKTNETQAESVPAEPKTEQNNTSSSPAYNGAASSIYPPPYFYQNMHGQQQASYTFSNDPSFGAEAQSKKAKKEKKKSKGVLKTVALILVCVILSGASGVGGAFLTFKLFGPSGSSQSTQNNSSNSNANYNAPVNIVKIEGETTPETDRTKVISAVRDSVVEIVTENIQESQFYGQYVTSGAGSGVIISDNGYIITNNHVVEGANTIYVRTTNMNEYKATVVGLDEESDIAVIKIDATGLSYATIGDSDSLKLGEEVFAIGNPLGSLGGTVTNGIISALNREITIGGQKMVLLQTNAAVNPGNSGGGLFNMSGHLIGVVNAKSSSSSSETSIEGLGFAIPINHGQEVASQLIEFGYVKGRVSLGIKVNVYEKDYTYTQGWHTYVIKAGVYVEDPGKNTELQKNDRFISINGITVSSMSDIKAVLAECKVGDTIKATVARVENQKEKQVEINLTCYEFVPEKTDQ